MCGSRPVRSARVGNWSVKPHRAYALTSEEDLAAVRIEGSNPVLAVHDLDGSADWYCRVLGCKRSDPDPGNWVFCRAGAVTFMLGRCPDVPQASSLGDHSYVAYLVVDSVDDFYANALAENAEVLKPPTDEPWGRRELALRSPDGHRFMLGQAL
jgi:uncharacterized glyoxalase superfamily protein PhnB